MAGMDERDTLARIRFAAQMTRNSSPPHCRPITILILIMALGTIFIGMTMTIVAHWPGSVSVGFDPLSSPGPVILALGGIALIFGSILVCYFQRAEQKKKGEKFVSFATTLSRANLDASAHHHSKGSQLLEREPLRKVVGDDFDDFGSVDEAEAEPLRPGKNIKGQQVLDEVITTTTSYIEPMPGRSDDEHLPLPVRSKKNKNNGSNEKSKVVKGLENLSEVSEETEEPLLTSRETEEKKVKSKKKKKKINTDYSREILHSKRSSSEDRHQQFIQNQEYNGEDDDNDDVFPGQSLRVQVRAKSGTAVNIRYSSQNEEAPPHLERKKKSKRAAQS